MSEREWKPGDVALVEAGCWANRKVALRLDEGWSHVNGVSLDSDGVVRPIRPLIVLDLSDTPSPLDRAGRTEAKHLVDMLRETAENFFVPDAAELARKVADQIEAQIAPPKPDEPMGLGAVVEDATGTKWIRHDSAAISCPWINTDDCQARYRKYAEIDVVRKLSDGVRP